jgi:hypothetical protein
LGGLLCRLKVLALVERNEGEAVEDVLQEQKRGIAADPALGRHAG